MLSPVLGTSHVFSHLTPMITLQEVVVVGLRGWLMLMHFIDEEIEAQGC